LFLFTHITPLKAFIAGQKAKGRTIGFVPTMGALHSGHVSLIHQSKQQTDLTVCSIFVNPTQFNNPEDLFKYPRTIEQDIIKLAEAGCDVLFHPAPVEMYPSGYTTEAYNWGAVTHNLEGLFRPGHFDGVITIVQRLFHIVEPDKAFFGQKDFQQIAVVKQMVKVFNMPVSIVIGKTLREPDGLAMSSRNVRLTAQERKQALVISKAVFYIRDNIGTVELDLVLSNAKKMLEEVSVISLEYLSVVDPDTLEPVNNDVPGQKCVALIAAWCGNVRLIDNMELTD
jgi:pantoate--beta-alanine ligase